MKFVRWFGAFLFVGALSTVLTLSMSALGSRFWPVALLILVVGACVAKVRSADRIAPALMVGYGCAFTLALMASLPASVAPRSVMLRSLAYAILLTLLVASALVGLILSMNQSGKGVGWIVFALLLGVAVAFASGDKGGAGPMREFLRQFFSDTVAEVILWIARKAVHVGFYGLLAFLFYRGSKAGGLASPWPSAAFSLSHGAFDEYRQYYSALRMGTPVDLLFDAAGIYLALRWAGAWRRAKAI